MRHLVYSACSLIDPHFGILLEEAESLYRDGGEVTFAFCHGISRCCIFNFHGDPLVCRACRSCSRRLIRKYLSPGIRILPLYGVPADDSPLPEYHSVPELKQIVFRDVFIGYGVMSNYTSITRDPDPDFSVPEVKRYFDFSLHHAMALTGGFYRLMDEIKPDSVSLYTGRLIDNRPLFDIAQKRGIEVRINECIGGLRSRSKLERVVYLNHLPHSIPYNTELLEKVWAMDNEPTAEKERKGRDFFERRRRGVPAGDRVYTAGQRQGMLPDGWDDTKRNIVIFNSSEDEFSAVGKEFDQYALFPSQLEGIRHILRQFPSDEYRFYLRIHPNLSRVRFRYHTDLYALPEEFGNLTVIGADDPCSTYALMDAAEKVVVFGSTTGAEAAYWHKPVILLGGAFYYLLDICYTPRTLQEADELIAARLQPKDPRNAVKYGYYLLNRDLLAIPAHHVDYSAREVKIFGRKFATSAYMKLFGSNTLSKMFRLALLLWSIWRRHIPVPAPFFVDRPPAAAKKTSRF